MIFFYLHLNSLIDLNKIVKFRQLIIINSPQTVFFSNPLSFKNKNKLEKFEIFRMIKKLVFVFNFYFLIDEKFKKVLKSKIKVAGDAVFLGLACAAYNSSYNWPVGKLNEGNRIAAGVSRRLAATLRGNKKSGGQEIEKEK